MLELWWRFRIIGAGASGDQAGYYCVRPNDTEDFAKFDKPAVKIMF